MDLLLILRLLTVTVRLALVASLIALLVVGRDGTLRRFRRSAWVLVSWVHGSFAVSGVVIELQHLYWPADQALRVLLRAVYNHLFFLNGILDAVLPVALLLLFLGATRYRHWPLAGLAGIAVTAVAGVAVGALRSWDTLLEVSQILTFHAIAAHLVFLGLYLLKRLPEVDFYLAAFVAVDALFQFLLPIQEVFFQIVDVKAVMKIWHLHQLLQLTATAVQVAVVLSCVNSMRYRPIVPVFRSPA